MAVRRGAGSDSIQVGGTVDFTTALAIAGTVLSVFFVMYGVFRFVRRFRPPEAGPLWNLWYLFAFILAGWILSVLLEAVSAVLQQ